ncbi:hypothetical protein AZZ78_003469, partial [Klebsiella pneumoniae]
MIASQVIVSECCAFHSVQLSIANETKV